MKTRGRELHDGLIEVYGSMILDVKARMDAGEDVPDCLVKTLLMTQEEEKLDWEDLCMLSAVFTLGGFASVITYFLLLLVFISLMTRSSGCFIVERQQASWTGSWLSYHLFPQSRNVRMKNSIE